MVHNVKCIHIVLILDFCWDFSRAEPEAERDTVNLQEKAEPWRMLSLRRVWKEFQGGHVFQAIVHLSEALLVWRVGVMSCTFTYYKCYFRCTMQVGTL